MEGPPCKVLSRADAIASTASRPTFVTIAIRPSEGGTADLYGRFRINRSGLFFALGLDRFLRKRADVPVGLMCRIRAVLHFRRSA